MPHDDVFWREMRRAETRAPHQPLRMLSQQSHAPPFFWACPVRRCGAYAHTYQPDAPAPICYGGMPWSFQTREALP